MAICECRQSTGPHCTRRLRRSHAMMLLYVSSPHTDILIPATAAAPADCWSRQTSLALSHWLALFTAQSLIAYERIKWNDYNYSRSQFVPHQSYPSTWPTARRYTYTSEGRHDMLSFLRSSFPLRFLTLWTTQRASTTVGIWRPRHLTE